jgi:predicted PurR-regulated permease PerM
MEKEINISFKSLWRICLVVVLIAGFIYFRQILLIFLASLILSASLENIIVWFERKKIPRILSTTLVYIILTCTVGALLYIIVPPLLQNIINLTNDLPSVLQSQTINEFLQTYLPFLKNQSWINNIFNVENTANYVGSIWKNLYGILSEASNFLLVLLISFYLSIEKRWFKNILEMFLPKHYKKYFIELWDRSEKKMVFWLYSQLVLCVFLTSLSIIVFYIMGIEYPLLSAVLYGVFDFIPFIGPILATIIIVLINISGSISQSGILIIVCILLQYVQNIISPYVRSKFLKVDPIVTLFFIALFGKFGGALGVFVAIPLSAIIVEFLKDLNNQKICDDRFCKLL